MCQNVFQKVQADKPFQDSSRGSMRCNNRKRRSTAIVEHLLDPARRIFERDDISRITTSKRDTKTHKGVKRQRRVRLDTLKNLHAQFESEFPAISLSYSLFCRIAFHVQQLTTRDRKTCLCKLHENASFLFDNLKQLSLVPPYFNTMDACIQKTVAAQTMQVIYASA